MEKKKAIIISLLVEKSSSRQLTVYIYDNPLMLHVEKKDTDNVLQKSIMHLVPRITDATLHM